MASLLSSCFELILPAIIKKCFDSHGGYRETCIGMWHTMEPPLSCHYCEIIIIVFALNSSHGIKPLIVDFLNSQDLSLMVENSLIR